MNEANGIIYIYFDNKIIMYEILKKKAKILLTHTEKKDIRNVAIYSFRK
jgi:hypothetical protein